MRLRKLFVAIFAAGAMAFGFSTLVPQSAEANDGQCCAQGADCPEQDLCCLPNGYPCNDGADDGYCRQTC
jgi:hypothetical protein